MEKIHLSEELKELLIYAEKHIEKNYKKTFMGKVVNMLGVGGQRLAERELNWNRGSIRKGQQELSSGMLNNKTRCGRKKVEVKYPKLLEDLVDLVDEESQIDPKFQSENLYPKITARETRMRLVTEKGYVGTRKYKIPSIRTINRKLNALGYKLGKVQKNKPIKKIPQTNAIFEKLHEVNRYADLCEGALRISMDAKAKVKVGPFARGGKNRKKTSGVDHDFDAQEVVIPWGIQLPHCSDLYLYFTASKITADFIVDCLEHLWPTLKSKYNPYILVLNLDNGMENSSYRTQFIKRLVDFSYAQSLTICLAYYPPYHSKYNPIERSWAVLEQHWNGEILDSKHKILSLAKSMTWRKKKPVVDFVDKTYQTGVTLSKEEMDMYEKKIHRFPGLEKWFVAITP